jgi:hypothetical protein
MWCHRHNVEEEGKYWSVSGQCWLGALQAEPCDLYMEHPPDATDEWRAPAQPDLEQT